MVFTSFFVMAEYMLAVLRRIGDLNIQISLAQNYRDNLPSMLELLRFDADLTVTLLKIQRDYLVQVFGTQVLLALMWILFIE